MTPTLPHAAEIPGESHLATALAVLHELGPEGIARLRRPMGVLMYRLGKVLCAEVAPARSLRVLLHADLEASMQRYPELKWQETGLREALDVLTRLLDELGRYCADAPDVPDVPDVQDRLAPGATWGQPLPFLPLFDVLGTLALAFPVRPDSRRYEPRPGEEAAVHAGGDDKPKVRQEAHRSFATLLDACDYQAGFWNAPFKSELAFAPSGTPCLGNPPPRPARKGDCHWRKPKGSLCPDIVLMPPQPTSASHHHARHVTHAVELKLTQDALGLNQSQNHVDMFGRDRFHVLYAGGLNAPTPAPAPTATPAIGLPAAELLRWIGALRSDTGATATAVQDDPSGLFQTPATWRLTMSATAFFDIRSKADVGRLATLLPQLHEEFQALTGQALTRYMGFKSGAISRKRHTQEDIEARYLKHADGIVSLHGFDAPSRESSSRFEFQALARFRHARLARAAASLDYLALHFPPDFWAARHNEVRAWWLSALQRLQPVQAYMGLGIGRPPVLERHPFQEPAELALARCFLGLDIDKPFFMRAGLEDGLRTPAFGVLVYGDHAARLGGVQALRRQLGKAAGIRAVPCMDDTGLWIEAGDAPALHPVEDGVPAHLRALAQALAPVRLERLWMVSYPPNLPRDDIFTPETSARWLRRFDTGSDWAAASATARP